MRTREWLTWALGGMLLASALLNGYQWWSAPRESAAEEEARPESRRAPPTAQALGLTDEQRSQITSCCGT